MKFLVKIKLFIFFISSFAFSADCLEDWVNKNLNTENKIIYLDLNVNNEKISMTSPVTMRQYGDQEMIFRLPKKFLKEKAPQPQNNKIKIFKIAPKIKAAIKYSGYTNSNIERKKTEELLDILKNNNISHLNDIEVDVFNSPFQFINRRNEITVTLSSDF